MQECRKFYPSFFTILTLVHTGYTESNFLAKESCLCSNVPVHNLTYECTTVGLGTTLWRGTAFDCIANGDEIALRHSLFTTPEGASGQCNNGNITGHILRVKMGHYTSRIHILFSPDLLGRTVECVHYNLNSYELIGSSTIVITTDPLPPPDDIMLSEIRPGLIPELRFNWTKYLINNCQISYSIVSDCGNCPTSIDINTAVCINVPVDNRTCSFAVKTVVSLCGSVEGTYSDSLSVTLKVPDPPSIDAVPLYSHETGQLVGTKTTFMETTSFTITDGFDGAAISYTITYTEATSDKICGTETMLSSSCRGGICTHLFELSSSSCGSVPISITVLATNILGSGPLSNPVSIFDTFNILFNVTFELSSGTAICTFLNQHESTIKTCTLMYNQSDSCQPDNPVTSQTAESVSNTVRISFPFANNLHDSTELHCFVVSASNGIYRAIIQGTLNTGCDPNHLYDGPVTSSSDAVAVCDPPLNFIGSSDGYACYSGTLVGAYAVHRCLNCDYRSVRVCMSDGTWNGTALQCKCNPKVPFQLSLVFSMVVPLVVLFALSLAFVIVITVILRKSWKNRAKVKALQAQVMEPELPMIYEEIDSKPEHVMEENMAYNTVQEFQETVKKSEDIPA